MAITGKIHITDHHGEPVGEGTAFSIDLVDGQCVAMVGESPITYPNETEEGCLDDMRNRFGGDVIIVIDDFLQ